ncbi:MAG: uroporphyrinogen-III synthase, partial [Gemmatimonadales bacterium]
MTDTVVLTASAGAFPGLAAALGRIRVAIEERPLMSFAPPANGGPLDAALERLGEYGSIAFTSPRAAHAVARRMKELAVGWPPVRSTPVVWATGPATAAGLSGGMGSVRLPAGRRTGRIGAARALGRAMLEKQASGPVLFPCGESHRDELPLELRAGGLSVDEVVCYRSVLAAIAEAR